MLDGLDLVIIIKMGLGRVLEEGMGLVLRFGFDINRDRGQEVN